MLLKEEEIQKKFIMLPKEKQIQIKAIELVIKVGEYAFKEEFQKVKEELEKFKDEILRDVDQKDNIVSIFNKIFQIRKWINDKYKNDEKKYKNKFPLTVSYGSKRDSFNMNIDILKIPNYDFDGFIYDIEENNKISVDIENNKIFVDLENINEFKKIKKEKSLYKYLYINELDHFFTYWLYKVIKPSKRMPSNLESGLYLILLDAIDENNSEEGSVMEF